MIKSCNACCENDGLLAECPRLLSIKDERCETDGLAGPEGILISWRGEINGLLFPERAAWAVGSCSLPGGGGEPAMAEDTLASCPLMLVLIGKVGLKKSFLYSILRPGACDKSCWWSSEWNVSFIGR